METPQPVNINALSAILAKSRQVMNVVESTNPVKQVDNSKTSTVGYENETRSNRSQMNEDYGYNERDEREPVYETYQPKQNTDPITYTPEQVMASKLPDAVKALMIKTPIPQFQAPPSKFSAEDISRITGAPIKTNQPQQRVPVSESVRTNSDMITISKSELKDMINEGISTFFKQIYDKTVTEETIKKTINLLIKEGKINVKKKP